jgi:hypothetical protein
LDAEIVEEVDNSFRGLGHFVFNSEGGPVGVAEESGGFVAEDDGFCEEGYVGVDL